jgi:hypothetical protein
MSYQYTLPDPPTQANLTLSELEDSIRGDVEAMAGADQNKLQHALAAGTKLIKAHDLNPDRWRAWLRTKLKMKPRLAQTYMQLARNRATVEAHFAQAAAQSSARPSIDAALRFLRKHNGTTKAPIKRKPKTAPASLDLSAWSKADHEERRKFIDGVGWNPLRKAIPPEWERQVLSSMTALQLVEALGEKFVGDKAVAKVMKELRKVVRPKPLTIDHEPVVGNDPGEFPAILRRDPAPVNTAVNAS